MHTDTSIVHPVLLKPIRYNNGLLYAKEKSTLETEIENRKRGYNIVHFNEEEIFNTFTPVIECIAALHQNNLIHGALSPASIVITDEDEIKVRDWLIDPKENIYYFNKSRSEMRKEDDWIALGQILLQAATLKKSSKLFFEK
jgi:serine/threonine protein kinase